MGFINPIFPSPISPDTWDRYIQAYPTHEVRPLKTFYTEGTVDIDTSQHKPNITFILKGQGSLVTFEFAQNITGRSRLHLETDPTLAFRNQSIGISLSTSAHRRDNSTRLLPLLNDTIIEDVRDVFKYVTLFIPPSSSSVSKNGTATIALRDVWVVYLDNIHEESEEKTILEKITGDGLEVELEEEDAEQVKAETIRKAKNSLLAGILKILKDSWGG
ncbi:uncharacterized protein H6S33_003442 [Morchella sextelata]|uniref:uncharacterized protein n=1 Tax=Morchella sextelata TaxID=1174677 RepID=UPI001D04681A|nr:uncharacterized protein H6S33_003442 [Morchella sextelata]KAH0606608.1 hypothetical protein H6S33_003442 [Morchella sextelata]